MVDLDRNFTAPLVPAEQASTGQLDVVFCSTRVPERIFSLAIIAAWQLALLTALLVEAARLKLRLLEDATPGIWWENPACDGTFLVPLLLLAPFCWGYRFRSSTGQGEEVHSGRVDITPRWFVVTSKQEGHRPVRIRLLGSAFVVGLASLLTSWESAQLHVAGTPPGQHIGDVLPLVQDELSYQLQAQGVLEGRWWWPGPERAPELFHQMHVLNEGRFASRYFPGNGAWIAPWLAVGHPVWGSRCAGILIAIGMLLIGSEIGGWFAGTIAGLLTALSPGGAIFNNLLLAHQPTLVGLTIFLLCFFRWQRRGQPRDAWLAGTGLTVAMLCRPLTAAAVGLPLGAWFLTNGICSLFSHPPEADEFVSRQWGKAACGLAIPLVVGFVLIGWQNRSLTGHSWLTPYQLYTQLYTPRHAFGFHQTQPAFTSSARQVLHNYNDWAEDLDLPLAVTNFIRRLRGSLAWGLGLIPLLMTAMICLLTLCWQPRSLQLLFASIVTLHLVHLPYWLAGMLDHHYVYESGPLWIVIFAVISCQLLQFARQRGCRLFFIWWGCLVAISIGVNYLGIGERGISRVASGWQTFLLPTAGYRTFTRILEQTPLETPALVLIRPHEGDLHAQYVRNKPPFQADVLIGMERPELYSVTEISTLFPDRTLYRYDTGTQQLTQLISPSSTGAAP